MSDSIPQRSPDASHPIGSTYWVNWTSASKGGSIVLAGTYHASQDQNYGMYAFHPDGSPRWVDAYPSDAYCGVFWVDVASNGTIAASGGWKSKKEIPHAQAVALTPDATHHGGAALDTNAYDEEVFTGFVRIVRADTDADAPPVLLTDVTGSRVNTLAVSADGTWIAAGSGDYGHRDNATRLYQCDGDRIVQHHRAAEASNVQTLAMSDDGAWIVIGTGNGEVRLFHNVGGTLVDQGVWSTGARYVQFVDITPDGSTFVAAGSDGHVFCFDRADFVHTPQCQWRFSTDEPKNVYGVTISDDGTFVAASANANGGTIYGIANTTNAAGDAVADLQWRFSTKKPPSPSVTLDASATYLTVADGYPVEDPGHYYLLDVASGEALWTYQTPNMSWPMVISADASAIVAGSDDGTVYFYDGATG